jgi:hypothetical protein
VTPASTEQVRRLQAAKRWLSRNDVRVIVMGQLLRQLSISPTAEVALALLDEATEETENVIGALNGGDATKEIQ